MSSKRYHRVSRKKEKEKKKKHIAARSVRFEPMTWTLKSKNEVGAGYHSRCTIRLVHLFSCFVRVENLVLVHKRRERGICWFCLSG